MDNTVALSNLKIGGLPTLGAEIGAKDQKTHFPPQKNVKICQILSIWGAGDGIAGIQRAIGEGRTSPLSQAPQIRGGWGCVTSFLANFPKKSNFRLKFWLIFAKFCQKLPCRTLLQLTRGHQMTKEGRQCVGNPRNRGSCHEMDPLRAKN